MKTVYACFTTDVIHEGHLNIIHKAKEYGKVIVGVLSDEAMVKFDAFQRYLMMRGLHWFKRFQKLTK